MVCGGDGGSGGGVVLQYMFTTTKILVSADVQFSGYGVPGI